MNAIYLVHNGTIGTKTQQTDSTQNNHVFASQSPQSPQSPVHIHPSVIF